MPLNITGQQTSVKQCNSRQHPIRGVTTAMTCLPHDSLIHSYHPEGCRTELSTGEKLCLCSERDFCNSATRSVLSLVSLFLFMTLLLWVESVLFVHEYLTSDMCYISMNKTAQGLSNMLLCCYWVRGRSVYCFSFVFPAAVLGRRTDLIVCVRTSVQCRISMLSTVKNWSHPVAGCEMSAQHGVQRWRCRIESSGHSEGEERFQERWRRTSVSILTHL